KRDCAICRATRSPTRLRLTTRVAACRDIEDGGRTPSIFSTAMPPSGQLTTETLRTTQFLADGAEVRGDGWTHRRRFGGRPGRGSALEDPLERYLGFLSRCRARHRVDRKDPVGDVAGRKLLADLPFQERLVLVAEDSAVLEHDEEQQQIVLVGRP